MILIGITAIVALLSVLLNDNFWIRLAIVKVCGLWIGRCLVPSATQRASSELVADVDGIVTGGLVILYGLVSHGTRGQIVLYGIVYGIFLSMTFLHAVVAAVRGVSKAALCRCRSCQISAAGPLTH